MQHSCQVRARIKTLRASLRGQGRLSSDPDSITSFLLISTLKECNRDFVLKIHGVNRSVGGQWMVFRGPFAQNMCKTWCEYAVWGGENHSFS